MRPSSATERSRRRGQAAVETMVLSFGVMVVLVAMFHLFTLTWSTAQAHIRAREALLHGTSYMQGDRASYASPGTIPFDTTTNFPRKAQPGTSMEFNASAHDYTLDDFVGSEYIQVDVYITESGP